MTAVQHAFDRSAPAWSRGRARVSSPLSRAILLLIVAAALAGGVMTADTAAKAAAAQAAGEDLTRLMRFMAAIKGGLALAALAGVVWRLGTPVSMTRFVAYGAACAAMGAGPGLIWTMTHVALGALLLHGGLLVAVLMLWRDPAVADRLAAMLPSRAGRVRRRSGAVPSRPRGGPTKPGRLP